MPVSILEALMNAEANFKTGASMPFVVRLAQEQLHNAVVLLEKGYSPHEEVEPLIEQYGSVEAVPEKETAAA